LARAQFQTLSEPMYYILLALTEECCGVDVMRRVTELSCGRVTVGPGTLYTLLARFQESMAIREIGIDGRKRAYRITSLGLELLTQEYQRLQSMADDGRAIMEGLK